MNAHLARARALLRAAAEAAGSGLRAGRFWLLCGALGLIAVVAAYSIGRSAVRSAALHDAETRRIAAIASGVDRWIDRAGPVIEAESALWRESDRAVRTITSAGTDPTSIARLVASRADEAGIPDLGLRLLSPDSVPPEPPRDVGVWMIRPGGSALAVEFIGDWSAIIAFVGSLPPQVAVARVEVEPGPGPFKRARVLLSSREISSGSRPLEGWPDEVELDSLSRYLAPVRAAPRPDDYAAFIPARPAPAAPRPRSREAVAELRVSAILITGDRRIAIINDQSVRAGDRIGGEASVLSIGRDHVVVRERNGALRTLRLSTGTEQLQ